MKTVTIIGLVFLVFGLLLLGGFVSVLVRFVVGGSANPPLSSPTREFVSFFIQVGTFWFIFVIVGVLLITFGRARTLENTNPFPH